MLSNLMPHLVCLSSSAETHADTQIFFYLYIGFLVVSSCYTLVWDLKMDWGLFDRNAGENTFLREEIVYPLKVFLPHTGRNLGWYTRLTFSVLEHKLSCMMCSLSSVSVQAYYYSAIVEDVLLRFSWTLTLTLSTVSKFHGISDILATVLAPMEVFRYLWPLFYYFIPFFSSYCYFSPLFISHLLSTPAQL